MGYKLEDVKFYHEPSQKVLKAFVMASRLIDFYLFFGISAYLLFLYFALQGFKLSSSGAKEEKKD